MAPNATGDGFWHCPDCATEYVRDGNCADCDVPLEPGQPEETVGQPVELCPILELGNPGDIAFAKSLLGSAGIAFHMRGEGVHSMYGSSVAGTALFGAVKVMVDKERADEAVELLAELITADWGDDEPEP